MKSIYVDGGSTAFGMFDPEHGGWAHRLHLEALAITANRMNNPSVVHHRALPGRTLPGIVRSLEQDTLAYRHKGPFAVVLQIGINESKVFTGNDRPIISPDLFGRKLIEFCDITALSRGPAVLVAPQPINESVMDTEAMGSTLEAATVEEYAAVMREVADSRHLNYIDTPELFSPYGLDEVLDADGYHPNALGHTILHGAISDVLHSIHAF